MSDPMDPGGRWHGDAAPDRPDPECAECGHSTEMQCVHCARWVCVMCSDVHDCTYPGIDACCGDVQAHIQHI